MKQYQLADAAGISRPYIAAIESMNIKKSPSTDTLLSIAKVLDVRVGDLFDDAKPISVAGKVGAGAKVPLIDDFERGNGLYHVACPADLPHRSSIVAVEVEGDSMFPVYKNGDVLFYSRETFGVPTEALGSICVCEDENGNAWVKHIKPGSQPETFHLISVNPFIDNMFDVKLKWAAPVRLAWPNSLVERI